MLIQAFLSKVTYKVVNNIMTYQNTQNIFFSCNKHLFNKKIRRVNSLGLKEEFKHSEWIKYATDNKFKEKYKSNGKNHIFRMACSRIPTKRVDIFCETPQILARDCNRPLELWHGMTMIMSYRMWKPSKKC